MYKQPFCPECPTQTVYDPPVSVYNNQYHPQLVNVVQPVQIVNQHHCVPVYQSVPVYSVKDVMCSNYGYGYGYRSANRSKKR